MYHIYRYAHMHFFCTLCPITDVRQVWVKDLEPVYSQSKSSVGEVVGFTPDFILDLRAAGCLAIA